MLQVVWDDAGVTHAASECLFTNTIRQKLFRIRDYLTLQCKRADMYGARDMLNRLMEKDGVARAPRGAEAACAAQYLSEPAYSSSKWCPLQASCCREPVMQESREAHKTQARKGATCARVYCGINRC